MNIGIDLGTTNSALAWIDPAQAVEADSLPIHALEAPQYVAQGRIETRRTLPSFLYFGDQEYLGVFAREQGALVPTKCVHSAKSWLSNPGVDRTAKILPWDAQEAGQVISPVEVSSRIVKFLVDAWSKEQGSAIGEHNVVLTVPASFDEEARELTVTAAREAGIEKLTLLEEPAAAFYSWIANDLARSQKSLFDGQMVLVCDVGGGTSDFTLIRVIAWISRERRSASIFCSAATTWISLSPGWWKRNSARRFPSGSGAGCGGCARPPKSACCPSRI
jgi:molecular chaperone DnaK (HSP70)